MPKIADEPGLPDGLKAKGRHNSPFVVIPKSATFVRHEMEWDNSWPVRIDQELLAVSGHVQDLATVRLEIEISFDNGVSWEQLGMAMYSGKPKPGLDATSQATWTHNTALPPERGGVPRRVRHGLVCIEPVTTATRVLSFG